MESTGYWEGLFPQEDIAGWFSDDNIINSIIDYPKGCNCFYFLYSKASCPMLVDSNTELLSNRIFIGLFVK